MSTEMDPQFGLPEFLRRRQATYAQAPGGLLATQAFNAAGPFPTYNPAPMNIAPPLPPAPSMTGSSGGGGAAGGALGGILGTMAQNPKLVSELANQGRNLFGGGAPTAQYPGSMLHAAQSGVPIGSLLQAPTPAFIEPSAVSIGANPAVEAAISQAALGAAPTAAFPGSMLAAAQSGAPLSALFPSLATPSLAAPSAVSIAANPAVDAAISQAASSAAPAAGGIPWGTIAGGAAALGGGLLAYDGIRQGREGQSALGGAIAGAGIGSLAGLSGLAALGPAGLVGAGVAALASSLVNTKEFGDVALRNYWSGVDQGRSIGESDPTELAQGFINFYRTNKNEFAPQAVYGRTGNEDFLYDMTQKINAAVSSGAVPPDATPGQIYSSVVEPWMQTMGSGPQDEKAKAIQDFMMTDLINSYQQGKPISNAQVKGDSNFRIVSERPTYPGSLTPTPNLSASGDLSMTQGFNPQDYSGLLGGFY